MFRGFCYKQIFVALVLIPSSQWGAAIPSVAPPPPEASPAGSTNGLVKPSTDKPIVEPTSDAQANLPNGDNVRTRPARVVVLPFSNISRDKNLKWLGKSISVKLAYGLRRDFGLDTSTEQEVAELAEEKTLNGRLIKDGEILDIAIGTDTDIIIYGSYRKTGFAQLPALPGIVRDNMPLRVSTLEVRLKIFNKQTNRVVFEQTYSSSMDQILTSDLAQINLDMREGLADFALSEESYNLVEIEGSKEARYKLVIVEDTRSENSPFFEESWRVQRLSAWFNTGAINTVTESPLYLSTNYYTYFNPSNKFQVLMQETTYLDWRRKHTVFGTDFTEVINLYYFIYSAAVIIDVSLFVNNFRFLYLTAGSDTLQTLDEQVIFGHKQAEINRQRVRYFFWVQHLY